MSDRLKIIMRGFPKFMSAASEETHWLTRSMKTGVRYLSQDSSTVTYRVRSVSAGFYLYMATEKKSRTFPWLRTEMNYTAHGKSRTTVRGGLSPVYRLRAIGDVLSSARTWEAMKSGFRLAGEQVAIAQTNLYPHIDAYERMKGKSTVSAFANVLSKSWIALDSPLTIHNRLRTTISSYGVMAESMRSDTEMLALSMIHAPDQIYTLAAVSPWDAHQTMRAVIQRRSGIGTALSNSKQQLYGRIASPGALRFRYSFRNHTAAAPRNQYRINTIARPLTGFPVSHVHTLTVRTEQLGELILKALPVAYTKNRAHSESFAYLYGNIEAPHSNREKLAANQSTYGSGRIGYGLTREMFAKFGYRVESDDFAYQIRTQLHFSDQYYAKIMRQVYHSASLDNYAHLTAESTTFAKTQSQMCAVPRYLIAGKTKGAFHDSATIFSGHHLYPHLIPLRVETEHRAGIRQYPRLVRRGLVSTGIHTSTNTFAQVERRLWYNTRTVSTGALYTQFRTPHRVNEWVRPMLLYRFTDAIATTASNRADATGWYRTTLTANALIDEELCIRTHSTATSETRNTGRRSFYPTVQGLGVGRERHGLHAFANPLYGYPVRPGRNMLVSTASTAHLDMYSQPHLLFHEKHSVVGSMGLWAKADVPQQSSSRALGRIVFQNAGKPRSYLDGFSFGAVHLTGTGIGHARHIQAVITHAAVNAVGAGTVKADSFVHSLLGLLIRVHSKYAGYTRSVSAARYQITDALRPVGSKYAVCAVAGFPAHDLYRKLHHAAGASGSLVQYAKANRPIKHDELMTAMEHVYITCAKRPASVRFVFGVPVRYFARPMERQRLVIDTPDALFKYGFRIPPKTRLGTTSQTFSSQHFYGRPWTAVNTRSEASPIAGFLIRSDKLVTTRARSNSFFASYAGSRERHSHSYTVYSQSGIYSQSQEYAIAVQTSNAALSSFAKSDANTAHTVDTIGRGYFYASAQKVIHLRDRASSYMELGASSDTTATWDTYANGNILLPFVFHVPLCGHREAKTSAAVDSHGRERGTVSSSNETVVGVLVEAQSDLQYGRSGSATWGLVSAPRQKYRVDAQCNVSSYPA